MCECRGAAGSRTKRRSVSGRDLPEKLLGADRDIIRIHGDIIAPLDVEWEAEVNPDRVKGPPSDGPGPLSSLRDED